MERKKRGAATIPTKIEDLAPAEYNPRRMTDAARLGLERSIERFGDLSGIVWNRRTGHLVAGHQRVDALRKLGGEIREGSIVLAGERFPIREVDVDESEEKAACLTANNRHIQGTFLHSAEALLAGMKVDAADFETLRLDKLLQDVHRMETLDVEEPPPARSKSRTKKGEQFELGRHQLFCGDAMERSLLDRALAGESVEFLLTDPPYELDLVDAPWLERAEPYYAAVMGSDRQIVGLCAQRQTMFEYFVHYFCDEFSLENSFRPRTNATTTAVFWDRSRGKRKKLGNLQSVYHFEGRYALARGTASRPREESRFQKHIQFFAELIRSLSNVGDLVFDPFAGSGTSLFACEQLGRRWVGIELAPAQCDEIRGRWDAWAKKREGKK